MRTKPEMITALGRAPARVTMPQLPAPPPPSGPPPERNAVRRWLRGALFDNVALKFLSMVLAVTVFLLVNTDKDREIVARIGVSYMLPDDKVLMSDRLEEVRVTVKGPWQRLRRFDRREVDRINLDLRHVASGELAITPEMIHLPSGLKVGQIEPRTVRIAFERRVEKVVEISAAISGRPQHGYVIADVKPTPATIRVRGAQSTLATLPAIYTRELSVAGHKESSVTESEVVLPNGVETDASRAVVVRITVDEQLVTQKLASLPIKIHGDGIDPSRWVASPAEVDVTLTGALLAIENAKPAVSPVVKVWPGDGRARDVAVTLEGLPPGIGVKITPDRIKLSPAKLASAP